MYTNFQLYLYLSVLLTIRKRVVNNCFCVYHFLKDPSNWSIIDILEACDLEPFDIKIEAYIKSLENIGNQEQDTRQGRARELLESYRKASNIFLLLETNCKWHDRSFLGSCQKVSSWVTKPVLDIEVLSRFLHVKVSSWSNIGPTGTRGCFLGSHC